MVDKRYEAWKNFCAEADKNVASFDGKKHAPCPCCGHEATARWNYNDYDEFFFIECTYCSCRVKSYSWESCLDEWEGHRNQTKKSDKSDNDALRSVLEPLVTGVETFIADLECGLDSRHLANFRETLERIDRKLQNAHNVLATKPEAVKLATEAECYGNHFDCKNCNKVDSGSKSACRKQCERMAQYDGSTVPKQDDEDDEDDSYDIAGQYRTSY